MVEDLPTQYAEYLDRFEEKLGRVDIGQFAKFRGKLIKKLTLDEFTPLHVEYGEMIEQYKSSLENGDTVNDVVLHALREAAAGLILDPPDIVPLD